MEEEGDFEMIGQYTNEDCITVMARYVDKFFDLAIVDPPYGININVSIGRRKGDNKSNYHKFEGQDKSIPSKEYFEELFRVSKNQIIWGGNYMTNYLYPSPCWLLWDKEFSEDLTFSQFEMAWTSFKSTTKKYNYSFAKNINRIHPTQKPVKLYEWILQKYSKESDTILDTHVGSASSLIACENLGFKYVGCELDKDYYEQSFKRLEEHCKQQKLF